MPGVIYRDMNHSSKKIGKFAVHLLLGWLVFTLLLLMAILIRKGIAFGISMDEILDDQLIFIYKDLLILLAPGFVIFGLMNRLLGKTRLASKKGEVTIILGFALFLLVNISFVLSLYFIERMVYAIPVVIESQLMLAAAMIVFIIFPFFKKRLFEYAN